MKQSKTYAIGIDVGATTIKGGAVDPKGKILSQISVDTKANKGPAFVLKQISLAIQEIFARHKPSECYGIGVGSPGVVMIEDGSVHYPPNFFDWREVQVTKPIRKVFPFPVFIENDANCAAIAEAKYGAGIDYKNFLFVIWGTGVGGGIILDKKIYRGPYGGAGEIGHVSIDYNGRLCNCGNRGCVESYIGQRYLSERTKDILKGMPDDQPRSRIETLIHGNLEKVEPAIISLAAEQGDSKAIEILQEAGELLGYALASVMNVLDLRVVVIGGGISASPQFVFNAIEISIKNRVLTPHRAGIRVVRASLGNSAGIIGAASLVF